MKKRKKYKYLMLILILLFIGIGYALLSVDLGISGVLSIDDGSWNVHFENYQQTTNSTVTPTSGNAPVIIGNNTTEISYAVSFTEPGELYEFTIDVVNGGTLDAFVSALETVVKDGDNVISNIPSYLDYSVTYSNGDEYVIPHDLAAGARETILVRVEFKRDITVAQYEEASGKELQFNLKIVFEQGTFSNQYHYLYTFARNVEFYVGEEMPDDEVYEVYDDYHDIDSDIFLRHTMDGNIVVKTDVGYTYNGEVYIIPSFSGSLELEETSLYILSMFGLNNTCEYNPAYNLECPNVYAYIATGVTVNSGSNACSSNAYYASC